MKLTVLIPIFKRYDVTKVCFDNLKRQQDKFGFKVVIVGSEGNVSRAFTEQYGFDYVEANNNPLGAKLNAGLKACEGHVVVLGSDNLISDLAFHIFPDLDLSVNGFYGLTDCLVFWSKTQQLSLFRYRNTTFKTIGVGRIYTESAIEACEGELWENDIEFGLDTSATNKVRGNGGVEYIAKGYHCVDIKHHMNLTNPNIVRLGDKRDTNLLSETFGEDAFKGIMSLEYIPGLDQIKHKPKRMKRNLVKIELLEDIGLKRKGLIVNCPPNRAQKLVKIGKVKYADGSSAPAQEEKPVDKPENVTEKKVTPKAKKWFKKQTNGKNKSESNTKKS